VYERDVAGSTECKVYERDEAGRTQCAGCIKEIRQVVQRMQGV
jgi:hypothetical protein